MEWCYCGHHEGDHDLESEPGEQQCRAPRCICVVFRPTGQGMPDMVLLNEFGSGLDADGNVIEEDPEGSLLNTPVEGADELATESQEGQHGEAKVGRQAEAGGQEDGVNQEPEIGRFDEHGQEIVDGAPGEGDDPSGRGDDAEEIRDGSE